MLVSDSHTHQFTSYHLSIKFTTPVPHQESHQLPVIKLYVTLYYDMLSFPVSFVISYHQLSFPSADLNFLFPVLSLSHSLALCLIVSTSINSVHIYLVLVFLLSFLDQGLD